MNSCIGAQTADSILLSLYTLLWLHGRFQTFQQRTIGSHRSWESSVTTAQPSYTSWDNMRTGGTVSSSWLLYRSHVQMKPVALHPWSTIRTTIRKTVDEEWIHFQNEGMEGQQWLLSADSPLTQYKTHNLKFSRWGNEGAESTILEPIVKITLSIFQLFVTCQG